MQHYQSSRAVNPQPTSNSTRPVLTVRHPDVESLLKGLPAAASDDWDNVRPWVQSLLRDRNEWSVRTARNRIPNSLARKLR
jgi:hypothetical protein